MGVAKVLRTLRAHDIHLSRSLGQHFLVDDNIMAKIVDAAELSATDTILEVGAGIGTLTEALAASGAAVIAVEVDQRLLLPLREVAAAWPNVTILAMDAMKLTHEQLTKPIKVTKVVANLPYNIAAPLLLRLAEVAPAATAYTVMVQEEIAQRIAAKPGNKTYGAYTVKLSYYFESNILFHVGANAFLPKPKVESAVVRLKARVPAVTGDRNKIFGLINAAFAQRRKMMLTTLAEYSSPGLTKSQVAERLSSAAIDPKTRPEQLTLADFARLAAIWP